MRESWRDESEGDLVALAIFQSLTARQAFVVERIVVKTKNHSPTCWRWAVSGSPDGQMPWLIGVKK
jgi:hypothetical protein